MWESGAYSADGIMRVFGAGRHSAAISRDEAQRIASLPVNADGSGPRCEALFERVYGRGNPKKARELGNTQPGDGWRFRGLGLAQATGRRAHEACAEQIGCTLAGLADPMNALHMLLIEWSEKDCNSFADKEDWISIRKLINGGSLKVPTSRINGIPDMMAAIKRASNVIGTDDFEERRIADVPSPKDPSVAEIHPAPPSSMAQSTEGQVAIGIKGTGIYELWLSFKDAWYGTKMTFAVPSMDFWTKLFFDERFWIGSCLVFGGLLIWLKRRQKLTLWGI